MPKTTKTKSRSTKSTAKSTTTKATAKSKAKSAGATKAAPAKRTPRKTAGALKAKAAPTQSATRDDIARQAFLIWERNGRPFGTEVENWLEAERELTQSAAA